jgi:hypothetical protein
VGTGPTSVRVLSFFAGVLLCVCAVLCAVIGDVFRCVLRPENLFDLTSRKQRTVADRNFNLIKIIVDGLLFLGGLIIIVLDGPWSPLLPWLRKNALVVTTVAGRGTFQLLVAFLALSQGTALEIPTPQFPFSLLFLLFSLLILFLPFVQAGTSSRSQTHGQTFPVCCTSGQRWCCWCWALPSLSLAWAPCARKSGYLLNTVQSQSRSLGK